MSAGDHDPNNKTFASGGSDLEAEKDFSTSDNASAHQSLHRQLKNRHIAMIRYVDSVDSLTGFVFLIHSVSEVRFQPCGPRAYDRVISSSVQVLSGLVCS
jgi:hypothetical protein